MSLWKVIIMSCFLFVPCILFGENIGFKSSDNTIENIQQIESGTQISLPIVSFIFDYRGDIQTKLINRLPETLGTGRIYHITLSPSKLSARHVHQGFWDEQYMTLFRLIKKNNLKVVFRTMHEMNGWRYPRSSNPLDFQEARKHVRKLSRNAELDQRNILFDFSIVHRDMPTYGIPSHHASMIFCDQIAVTTKSTNKNIQKYDKRNKKIWPVRSSHLKKCHRFEDYYPGDNYVDTMGVTFYNRGKASYDRKRLSPEQILKDPQWNTWSRLEKFNKPIVIDEVGTTAIRYTATYHSKRSREAYKTHNNKKNQRLGQLHRFIQQHPRIVATVYFNVDYTNGLSVPISWEADRAVINTKNGKIYSGILPLLQWNSINLTGLWFIQDTESKRLWNSTRDGLIESGSVQAIFPYPRTW